MSDETPFLAEGQKDDQVKFAPEPQEPSADLGADQMRAFEDQHFGKDAVRINGQIERGHGSKFNDLHPAHRREHAALERLIAAEKKLGEAEGALSIAQSDHDEAKLAVERAAKVAAEKAKAEKVEA